VPAPKSPVRNAPELASLPTWRDGFDTFYHNKVNNNKEVQMVSGQIP
jgi:hypothetical protein